MGLGNTGRRGEPVPIVREYGGQPGLGVVGTSGSRTERVLLETAKALMLPDRMCGNSTEPYLLRQTNL